MTGRGYVGGSGGRGLGNLRVATRARSLFRRKRSSERDKNTKSIILARDMSEEMQRKETYPEATGLCFFGIGTPTFCLFCC
jgi:hypothetical protein